MGPDPADPGPCLAGGIPSLPAPRLLDHRPGPAALGLSDPRAGPGRCRGFPRPGRSRRARTPGSPALVTRPAPGSHGLCQRRPLGRGDKTTGRTHPMPERAGRLLGPPLGAQGPSAPSATGRWLSPASSGEGTSGRGSPHGPGPGRPRTLPRRWHPLAPGAPPLGSQARPGGLGTQRPSGRALGGTSTRMALSLCKKARALCSATRSTMLRSRRGE